MNNIFDGKITMTLEDGAYPYMREYRFKGGGYHANCCFFCDPDTKEIDHELPLGVAIGPDGGRRSGLPIIASSLSNILHLEMLPGKDSPMGVWGIGYSVWDTVPVYSIDENSDPNLWRAKQFLWAVDDMIREMLPGKGLCYRDGDSRDIERRNFYFDQYFQKREYYEKWAPDYKKKHGLTNPYNE